MRRFNIICCSLVMLLGACTTDFLAINTNPNGPDKVSNPGWLLVDVIRTSANTNLNNGFNRGSIVADHLASSFGSNYNNWPRADATTYFFWNHYSQIRDLNEMIRISEELNMPNYKGVALVLRSWLFQNLTDTYGPIPFREAGNAKLEDIAKPRYAKQEDVYAGLLADLEEAIGLLGTGSEPIVGDILYNGNQQNWKKFATGLILRLTMRQSNVVDPSDKMGVIVANPSTYPIFDSHLDQAALQYIGDLIANDMPLFHKSSSDYATGTRMSQNFLDHLEAINDPRVYVFALPASLSGGYVGAVNGTGDWDDPAKYAPPGMLWASRQYSPDLASNTAAQSVMVSYSEVQLILAEAAERGFIPGGSAVAENHYRNAINDQITYYASRIPDHYTFPKASDVVLPADYFDQDGVRYEGSTSDRLEKIYIQKWFALFLNGFEAWSEWRRTGVPELKLGDISTGYVPQRCLYPPDELRINEAHYREAVSWIGTDELDTPLWWAKKD